MNLLAGAHGYPFRLFLAFDALGEALWAAGYLALGRFFGDGETDLEGLIGRVTGAALAAAAVLVAGTLVRQRLRRQPAGIA